MPQPSTVFLKPLKYQQAVALKLEWRVSAAKTYVPAFLGPCVYFSNAAAAPSALETLRPPWTDWGVQHAATLATCLKNLVGKTMKPRRIFPIFPHTHSCKSYFSFSWQVVGLALKKVHFFNFAKPCKRWWQRAGPWSSLIITWKKPSFEFTLMPIIWTIKLQFYSLKLFKNLWTFSWMFRSYESIFSR